MILALQKELDHADIVELLTTYNKNGSLFRLFEHVQINDEARERLILEVFRFTMQREILSVSVRIV